MRFDTSFLIDLMDGDGNAVEKARQLEADLVQHRLSSMTLVELYYDICRAVGADSKRDQVEKWLLQSPSSRLIGRHAEGRSASGRTPDRGQPYWRW